MTVNKGTTRYPSINAKFKLAHGMGLLGSVIQPVSAFVFLPTNNRSTHEEGPKEATVVPVMRCCLSCAFL